VLFSLPDAAHHEPLWFLSPDFSLDAGFQSCTQASIRLNTKMIHPNCFLPFFWLVPVDYLDVQSMHTRLQKAISA
jgi:hypothetical protein